MKRSLIGRKMGIESSLEERFAAYQMPEPNSGCFLWLGKRGIHGYGVVKNAKQEFLAHRVAWRLSFGPVPDGLHVCHKCDVRLCVNPAHLFLGTDADNLSDMRRKKRHPYGSKAPWSKVTEEDVIAIRRSPLSQTRLAAKYGLHPTSVNNIISRKNWKHVP